MEKICHTFDGWEQTPSTENNLSLIVKPWAWSQWPDQPWGLPICPDVYYCKSLCCVALSDYMVPTASPTTPAGELMLSRLWKYRNGAFTDLSAVVASSLPNTLRSHYIAKILASPMDSNWQVLRMLESLTRQATGLGMARKGSGVQRISVTEVKPALMDSRVLSDIGSPKKPLAALGMVTSRIRETLRYFSSIQITLRISTWSQQISILVNDLNHQFSGTWNKWSIGIVQVVSILNRQWGTNRN